jgi:hypothetical protein
VFFGRSFLAEVPRQHEFGFEHSPGRFDLAIEGGRHPAVNTVENPPLHLDHGVAGILLVPVSVQMLGHCAELDN